MMEAFFIPAPSPGTGLDFAHVLVLEASKTSCTIYDVRFSEVVGSHEHMAGKSLEENLYMFCTDPS